MTEIKTIDALRDFLITELRRVGSGESTPAAANAAANIAGKINQTVKLEMEYNKMVGLPPNMAFIKSVKNETKKIEPQEN